MSFVVWTSFLEHCGTSSRKCIVAGKKWSVFVERKELEEVAKGKQCREEENVGVRFKLHFTSATSQFTVFDLRSATHNTRCRAARIEHLTNISLSRCVVAPTLFRVPTGFQRNSYPKILSSHLLHTSRTACRTHATMTTPSSTCIDAKSTLLR